MKRGYYLIPVNSRSVAVSNLCFWVPASVVLTEQVGTLYRKETQSEDVRRPAPLELLVVQEPGTTEVNSVGEVVLAPDHAIN